MLRVQKEIPRMIAAELLPFRARLDTLEKAVGMDGQAVERGAMRRENLIRAIEKALDTNGGGAAV